MGQREVSSTMPLLSLLEVDAVEFGITCSAKCIIVPNELPAVVYTPSPVVATAPKKTRSTKRWGGFVCPPLAWSLELRTFIVVAILRLIERVLRDSRGDADAVSEPTISMLQN